MICYSFTDNYDQFEKYQSNLLGLPYDHDSIMHYGWNYFALNRKSPTIVPKGKSANIGNRKIMSATDVQKINILYQCGNSRAPVSVPSSGSSGSLPSSGTSSSGSIWDLLLGKGVGSSSSSGSGSQPAPTSPPATFAPRTEPPRQSASTGIKGAVVSFLKGVFGGWMTNGWGWNQTTAGKQKLLRFPLFWPLFWHVHKLSNSITKKRTK